MMMTMMVIARVVFFYSYNSTNSLILQLHFTLLYIRTHTHTHNGMVMIRILRNDDKKWNNNKKKISNWKIQIIINITRVHNIKWSSSYNNITQDFRFSIEACVKFCFFVFFWIYFFQSMDKLGNNIKTRDRQTDRQKKIKFFFFIENQRKKTKFICSMFHFFGSDLYPRCVCVYDISDGLHRSTSNTRLVLNFFFCICMARWWVFKRSRRNSKWTEHIETRPETRTQHTQSPRTHTHTDRYTILNGGMFISKLTRVSWCMIHQKNNNRNSLSVYLYIQVYWP